MTSPTEARSNRLTLWLASTLVGLALVLLAACSGGDGVELDAGQIELSGDSNEGGGVFDDLASGEGSESVDNGASAGNGSSDGEPSNAGDSEAGSSGNENSDDTGDDGGRAEPTVEPTPTPTPSPAPIISTPVEGPFGSGVYSHIQIDPTAAMISNVPPYAVDDADFSFETHSPSDPSERWLYVTFELVNDDKNDMVSLREEAFGVVIGDARPVTGQLASGSLILEPFSSAGAIVGFDISSTPDADPAAMQFWYSNDRVPLLFPLLGDGPAETPYPLDLELPDSIDFKAGSCGVDGSMTFDRVYLDIDYPAAVSNNNLRAVDNRINEGRRWLVVEAFVEYGEDCANYTLANLVSNNFRLVADGRPVSPEIAPNLIISAREAFDIRVMFAIDQDAETLTFVYIGDDDVEVPVDLDLVPSPVMPGEQVG